MIRIEIDSLNDEKMDIYSKLSEVQLLRYNEPKPGIFIAESENVIMRDRMNSMKKKLFLS